MITMIGTAHVFRIAEQVSFIIKHTWPDAVLIEMDERRYAEMSDSAGNRKERTDSKDLYHQAAKVQIRLSEKNGAVSGEDMIAAVSAGRVIGAEIICIDKDAEQTMRELKEEMPFFEGIRYRFASRRHRRPGRSKRSAAGEDPSAAEERYYRDMRRRFPAMTRKLIDERDAHMAERIKEASEKYKNIAVVVGDGHIRGICGILGDAGIDVIRLADMLDRERMDEVRSRIWNRKTETSR